ncbi:MAG TPA: TraB/GumN family protein, partial [Ferruginibacter sp.]|nr:TraB/GumN family protein [Ferruginibacter sp.]
MKIYSLVTLIFIISSCKGQSAGNLKTNESDNTLLWEVTGNGLKAPSYLFGTFHMLCKEDIKFSSPLKQAVKNSDKVYLEMDMDDPATLFGGLMLMNMKDGKKLKELYKPEDYKRVESFFKDSLKIPLTLFQSMKPYFLVAMLYPKMMPCKTVSGIEEELMKLAKEDKKEILGLETMAFQASIFDSIPYEKQADELLKSIDSMAMSKIYFDSMLSVYKKQQLNEIEILFSKNEFGMEEDQDILLDNRNKNWVAQLKDI